MSARGMTQVVLTALQSNGWIASQGGVVGVLRSIRIHCQSSSIGFHLVNSLKGVSDLNAFPCAFFSSALVVLEGDSLRSSFPPSSGLFRLKMASPAPFRCSRRILLETVSFD